MGGSPRSSPPAAEPSLVERFGKLAVSVTGIYTCYLLYGVFQEALYKEQPDGTKYSATAFVLFVQCAFNAVIALIGHQVEKALGQGEVAAPAPAWSRTLFTSAVLKTSVVYVLAMYTSNEALAFVSYPTQALVKSCKMIPVMFGSIIINGKRYPLLKYVCVLLMTVGITAFQFAGDSKKKGGHGAVAGANSLVIAGIGGESLGLLLLAASLCLDGITGPLQEGLKTLRLSNMEQMLVNNIWASALMLGIALVLDQVNPSIAYLTAHPALVWSLLYFSLTSAFGQIFIFWTIRVFNALTLSTITTTRKFFTIVVSVFVHGNRLAGAQWVAVCVVFAGLALELAGGSDKHGPSGGHHHRGGKHKIKDEDGDGTAPASGKRPL